MYIGLTGGRYTGPRIMGHHGGWPIAHYHPTQLAPGPRPGDSAQLTIWFLSNGFFLQQNVLIIVHTYGTMVST